MHPKALLDACAGKGFAALRDTAIIRLLHTTGIRAGEEIEVISGLQGDERIIPGNVAAYREGQQVEAISTQRN